MLTIDMLKAMPHGTIFATGKADDNPKELFIANLRKNHHWIAIRGGSYLDWAVYSVEMPHNHQFQHEYVAKYGNKVRGERNIRFCVPCDDEALEEYRK